MKVVTLAVTQMVCSPDRESNVQAAEALVRAAADDGAQLVLLQELFESQYFCSEQNPIHLDLAAPFENNPLIARFATLARELGVVLPLSFFERTERQFFNSLAMIDATGEVLGTYRKTHIPDGAGYQEKFYFTPGDSGFRVWDTAVGRIGAGICWDQWFPEAARAMALMGADILLYPTAIGSEPRAPQVQSLGHWQRTMQGHAAANMAVLMASNRIGTEEVGDRLSFYGGSFIADETGDKLCDMGEVPGHACVKVDLDAVRRSRNAWGLFRDRRPEHYGILAGN
ncbi:N-carbamoylputrescine amidase [uncultured Roseobacter sp.]|uniref:N-carbamoylputrescine amidase n=1 Tax=uncultured Roseobacter sp. TaxID=114847 RepID=UPI0026160F32|nr:N-carbamoylputrescine amidase [uncultured Roseobacter sp.]